MQREIEIQLLGGFAITVDGRVHDTLPTKSRRGVSLMTYLILQRGKAVAIQQLARELWGSRRSDNPENALKTLISRLRSLLNAMADGLGSAIQSEQGAYRWKNLPGVKVDVLEFIELAEELKQDVPEAVRWEKSRRALALYQGDLFQNGDMVNGSMQASWLHKSYLETVYAYVEMLKERDEYNEIARESAMAGIQEILRRNLRKGDIVTRFSPVIYAMLLPTVDYGTGGMVMERIEHLFYQEYPGGSVTIQHRISPLGGRPAGNFKQIS